jgi:hypothetical protein
MVGNALRHQRVQPAVPERKTVKDRRVEKEGDEQRDQRGDSERRLP